MNEHVNFNELNYKFVATNYRVFYTWKKNEKPLTGVFYDKIGDHINFYYCKDGFIHREDGPAVIHPDDGTKEYWLNGYQIIKNVTVAKRKIKKFQFKGENL